MGIEVSRAHGRVQWPNRCQPDHDLRYGVDLLEGSPSATWTMAYLEPAPALPSLRQRTTCSSAMHSLLLHDLRFPSKRLPAQPLLASGWCVQPPLHERCGPAVLQTGLQISHNNSPRFGPQVCYCRLLKRIDLAPMKQACVEEKQSSIHVMEYNIAQCEKNHLLLSVSSIQARHHD